MSETTSTGQQAVQLFTAEHGDDELRIQIGQSDLFVDPAVWGEVLACVARELAGDLQRRNGSDPKAILRLIADKFVKEMNKDSGAAE